MSKIELATLYFDFDKGEGTIKFDKNFYKVDWLVQADAMQNWAYYTEELYEALVGTGMTALTREKVKEVMK